MQFGGIDRRVERMRLSQYDAKMGEQVAGKQRDDVQSGLLEDIGTKCRFSDTKCPFTRRIASLGFSCGSASNR